MNYEDLYLELASTNKKLKDASAAVSKSYKNITKDIEIGDLKALDKEVSNYNTLIETQTKVIEELRNVIDSFDLQEYFNSGDFTKQLLDTFKENNVDVIGESPIFEVFPYRLRIDAENTDVYLNRKKMTGVRPINLVNTIKVNQEKLMKASFNAQSFLNELYEAYNIALLKTNKKDGTDLYLTDLYKLMTPMSRFRKDYDDKAFAYDIAKLYSDKETETTKSGYRYQLGPSRDNKKAIRILDSEGHEHYFATIRFFK